MSLDNFRIAGRFRAINRFCQVLLGLSFVGGLIWASTYFFQRIDITHQHRYTLSPETLAYIEKLKAPVTIYVTLSAHDKAPELRSLYTDIRELLREYTFASQKHGSANITVEFIDPFVARQRTEALATRFQIPCENTVIISTGNRYETLLPTDLYKSETGTINAFTGEQALTGAILRLTQEKAPKCYFTIGHGELNLKDVRPLQGLSKLQLFLKARGLETESLDIATEGIPTDAAAIVIAGPRTPFLQEEEDKIQRYLEDKSGRLIVLLSPQNPHGLESLLHDWGLLADDAVVIDLSPNAHISGGDLLLRRFAPHPITQSLIDYQLTVLTGLCSPVRPDPAALADLHRTITPFIASSNQSWAERHLLEDDHPSYEPFKGDFPGPITLACAVEKRMGRDLGLSIQGGRLVVFGTSDWITNHRLGILGNELLFWHTCHWALNQPGLNSLVSRPLGHYQLPLSPAELTQLLYFLFIPAAFLGILGLAIFFIRRR